MQYSLLQDSLQLSDSKVKQRQPIVFSRPQQMLLPRKTDLRDLRHCCCCFFLINYARVEPLGFSIATIWKLEHLATNFVQLKKCLVSVVVIFSINEFTIERSSEKSKTENILYSRLHKGGEVGKKFSVDYSLL